MERVRLFVHLLTSAATGDLECQFIRLRSDDRPLFMITRRLPQAEAQMVAILNHILAPETVIGLLALAREVRAERGKWGPAVVFECVGAAGLIGNIVSSVDMGTRIYCAGGWYTGDALDITEATRAGVTIQFGGGPMPQDWYGTLDAITDGRLDPVPSIGRLVSLDEVPDMIELARRSAGPPRTIGHPKGAPV